MVDLERLEKIVEHTLKEIPTGERGYVDDDYFIRRAGPFLKGVIERERKRAWLDGVIDGVEYQSKGMGKVADMVAEFDEEADYQEGLGRIRKRYGIYSNICVNNLDF